MNAPAGARLDELGNRLYTWTGAGRVEEFYSVTTIIGMGIPKHLAPWAAKLVAELAYGDVLSHGPNSRASAIARRWARSGRVYIDAQRADGMKLAKADESPKGLALRYLKGQPDRVRDAAAQRGSAVHDEAETFVLSRIREGARMYAETGDLPDWHTDIAPHMAQFVAWLRAYRPRYIATEATVYNRTQVYAGTGDAFIEIPINGRWTTLCLDYKSGRAIYPEVAIQTSAYAHGEFVGGADRVTEYPVPKVDGTAVLHLTPRGYAFRLLRYDDAVWQSFLYAREIFRWAIDISKTALGEPIAQDVEDALVASLEGVA